MARGQNENQSSNKCCQRCGECLIITLNVFAIIISLIIIVFGAVLLAATAIATSYLSGFSITYASSTIVITPLITQLQYSILNPAGIGIVVVGGVLFIMSIVGCCAAMKHDFCAMVIYGIFLGLIAITLIVTVALFATSQSYVIMQVGNSWQQLVAPNYVDIPIFQNTSQYTALQQAAGFSTNYLMYAWSCCGINNYADMQQSNYWNKNYQFTTTGGVAVPCNNAAVPPVCCRNISATSNSYDTSTAARLCSCMQSPTATNSYSGTPCFPVLQQMSFYSFYTSLVYPIVIGIWAGLGGLLFIFFIYTIFLMVQYRSRSVRQEDVLDDRDSHPLSERNKYDRTQAYGAANTNDAYMATPPPSAPPAYTSAPNYGIYAPATNAGSFQLPRY